MFVPNAWIKTCRDFMLHTQIFTHNFWVKILWLGGVGNCQNRSESNFQLKHVKWRTEVKAFETNSKYLKGHFQRFDFWLHPLITLCIPSKKTWFRTKNTQRNWRKKNDLLAKNVGNRANIGFTEISGSPVVCCENHILPEFVKGKWNYGGSRIRAAEEQSLSQCCWLLS